MGQVEASSLHVTSTVDIQHTLTVGDTLQVGTIFHVNESGMSIQRDQSARNKGNSGSSNDIDGSVEDTVHNIPLLSLTSSEGTILELNKVNHHNSNGNNEDYNSEDGSIMKAIINGVTTFDLRNNGHLLTKSLKLSTGGVHVEAGGVKVGFV